MLDEDWDNTQQPHADGEVGFLHRSWWWGAAAALTKLNVGGEEFNDERTDPFLQQEAELLVLCSRQSNRDRCSCHPATKLHLFTCTRMNILVEILQENHWEQILAVLNQTSVSSLSFPPTSKEHLHLPAGTNPARGWQRTFQTIPQCRAHFTIVKKNQSLDFA